MQNDSGSNPPSPHIDLELLSQFIDPEEGIGLFRDLVLDVIEVAPSQLEAIAAALRHGRHEEVKSLSHGLRGVLSNHGCTTIAQRLRELELAIPSAEDTETAISGLLHLWEESSAALLAWLDSFPDTVP